MVRDRTSDEVAQVTFGTILRDARERKGYDLASAARRLRIRPDILRAIEEGDFASMPPRGYTRNMVNAYARLVGLNPTELTRMYLDEAYAYQVGRARNQAQPATGFNMGGSSRTRASRQRDHGAEQEREREPRQNAFGRTLYDDRHDYGTRAGGSSRLYSEDRTHPSRHGALPSTQYTNFYAEPKATGAVQSTLPFIVAGAGVLVLLLVVLLLVFSCGNKESESDVPNVPITGLTDTTQQGGRDEGGEPQPAPVATPPSKATFSYQVADGSTAYIEVYEGDGGATVAEDISGPAERSFDVSSTLKFVTTNPEAVTISVDGAEVEPTDERGSGVYSYTVDFAAILAQWNEEHAGDDGGADPAAS